MTEDSPEMKALVARALALSDEMTKANRQASLRRKEARQRKKIKGEIKEERKKIERVRRWNEQQQAKRDERLEHKMSVHFSQTVDRNRGVATRVPVDRVAACVVPLRKSRG